MQDIEVLVVQFVVGVADGLAQAVFPAHLVDNGVEIVFHLVFHLLVSHLHTVDHTFVHQQFADEHTLQQAATLGMGVLHALPQTYLAVGLLDIGILDDGLSDDGHDTVNHLFTLLGLRQGGAHHGGEQDEQ